MKLSPLTAWTEEQRSTIVAALCISVLVAVAFFASYSGNSLRPSYQADRIESVEPANNPAMAQRQSAFNDKSSKNNKNSEQKGTEFWPPILGYSLKVTDTLVAIFTAFLFFATLALWLSTKGLVEGDKKTAERQLRAYIHIDDVKISMVRQEYDKTIKIAIKNFGLTPAHSIVNTCVCDPFPAGHELYGLTLGNRVELGDLGPTQKVFSTFQYPRGKWDSELFDIADGTKIFHVFGKLDYSTPSTALIGQNTGTV